MFAIYSNNGLNFRSTIDNLYNLSNVDSLARARNNINEGLPKDHSLKDRKKISTSKNIEEAREAYKKVANIDTKEPIFHVKDIMTKDVITLFDTSTLQEAYDLMQENDIRQIPILSFETKKIIGMVFEKTILDLIINDIEYATNTLQKQLSLIDFNNVITTDPITDIRRIAKVMVDFSLSAIPVVDEEDNLQGIVSRANVLKAVANTPPLQIWG